MDDCGRADVELSHLTESYQKHLDTYIYTIGKKRKRIIMFRLTHTKKYGFHLVLNPFYYFFLKKDLLSSTINK